MALVLAGILTMAAAVGAVDPDGQVTPGPTSTATVSSEVITAAADAQVDVVDLLGAMSSTQSNARQYLYAVGELERPYEPPPIIGALARADCIIGKESGGLDIPNRQGSGAWGPGQYMAGTWARHTALYRGATGYGGPLSLHNLQDVRRVMAFMLTTYPASRREWAVGGC